MSDRKRKYRRMYMHTIDGLPAAFTGEQICLWSDAWQKEMLAANLNQIRQEQEASRRYREKRGFSTDFKYSHIILRIDHE